MNLKFKYCAILKGQICCDPSEVIYNIDVCNKDKGKVKISFNTGDNSSEAYYERNASDGLVRYINRDKGNRDSEEEIPNEIETEINFILSILLEATKRVFYLLKYALKTDDISEELLSGKGFYWSTDGIIWRNVPSRYFWRELLGSRILSLRMDTANYIQEILNKNAPEPLFALTHLHRAKTLQNPRYKWIDATIAAELAIKEFLIRIKPDIEAFIIEMPSPSLRVLYGRVLESLTGDVHPC